MTGTPPTRPVRRARAVLTVSSNKGGVGKTTLATNLAVYLRALREELPVALIGLDDQRVIDRMFGLLEPDPAGRNLKHGWAQRCLDDVLQVGQYGVHFVPSPPEVEMLKARAEDPSTLRRILDATAWDGLYLLDTKSDLEALTRSALHAADRILIPIADFASLEEAAKSFRLLERDRIPQERARVVFTLVDRRSRASGDRSLGRRLEDEVGRRGWPRYETTLSRSPRVESLISGDDRPRSILHAARGTLVHGELRELAAEVLRDLDPIVAAPSAGDDASELWGEPQGEGGGMAKVRRIEESTKGRAARGAKHGDGEVR